MYSKPEYAMPINPSQRAVHCLASFDGERHLTHPDGDWEFPVTDNADYIELFDGFSLGPVTINEIQAIADIDVRGGCYSTRWSAGNTWADTSASYDNWTVATNATHVSNRRVRLHHVGQDDCDICNDFTGGANKARSEFAMAAGTALATIPLNTTRWIGFSFRPIEPDPLSANTRLMCQTVMDDGSGPELHLMWYRNRIRTYIKLSPDATDTPVTAIETLVVNTWYDFVIQLKRATTAGGVCNIWINKSAASDAKNYSYSGRTARNATRPDPDITIGLYNGTTENDVWICDFAEFRMHETETDEGFGLVRPKRV